MNFAGQEKSPRALISLGLFDFFGSSGTSLDIPMVEGRWADVSKGHARLVLLGRQDCRTQAARYTGTVHPEP